MSGTSAGKWSGLLYIGSYGSAETATLHACRLNQTTGELTVIQEVKGIENASYLAIHPNGRRLYAVKEVAEHEGEPGGAVAALELDPSSGLVGAVTGIVPTLGAHPCYVSVDEAGTALFAANYSGGSVSLHPLSQEGDFSGDTVVCQHRSEPGPVASRQEGPHAHCIVPVSGTPYVYAADLGMDAVVAYRYDQAAVKLERTGQCKLEGGAGPRHLVFHPSYPVAYVANELASSVTVLQADHASGTLTGGATYATIPADYTGYNDSADIHLSPDGRYLYASNRGHDSIAVFAVEAGTGELAPVQFQSSGGETPRNFGITPDGQFLLAANQRTGNVVVFRINREDGTLAPTGNELAIGAPVCVRFAR